MGTGARDEPDILTFEDATPAAVAALLDPRPPDEPFVPPGYRWQELRTMAANAGLAAELGVIRAGSDWEAAPTGSPLRVIAVQEDGADVIRYATTAALDRLDLEAMHGSLLGRGDDPAGVRVGGVHVDRAAREVWVQAMYSGSSVA